MSNFWTISLFWALFLLFILVAMAFVLPPLLLRRAVKPGAQVDRKEVNLAIYDDQLAELKADLDSGDLDTAQYEDARQEIEKRLSEEVPRESAPVVVAQAGRWPGVVLAVAIPLLAVALYVSLGNTEALLTSRVEAPEAHTAAQQGQHATAPMIAALEAKLEANPDDAKGWYMLARSYNATGQYGKAASAYAKASELAPDDPRLLADYADALAMVQGQNLQGKPLELIDRALKLNPNDEKSLHLAASAAYQRKDFAQAALYWRQLLKVLPPDAGITKDIVAAVEEAEKLAGIPGSSDSRGKPGEKVGAGGQAPQGATAISGTVTLSKELVAKVSPADRVFIFAQAPQGPRMPIASLKIDAGQLPYRFTLDDSVSMSPNDKLSNHAEVMISARVSKSGQPMAQSGDLQGKTGPVKPGQQGVAIVIDTVVP